MMIGKKREDLLGILAGGVDDDAGSMLSSLLSGGDEGDESSKGEEREEKVEEVGGNSTTLTATFNTSTSSHTIPSLSVSASQIEPNLLQSNYNTLLSMLREERRIRGKMNDKIANIEHTLLETSTSYELDIEDLKKENMDLKRKLRKLSKESAYKEVFEQFESEIKGLRNEATILKDANVRLEMKLAEVGGARVGKRMGKGDGGKAGTTGGPAQPPMQYQDGLMKQLSRRNRELEEEVKKLRAESADLKQKGRLLDVSKTQIQHSQSNMLKLGDELRQKKHQAYTLNMSNSRLEEALLEAEKEAAQWRQLHAESESREEKMKGELQQATVDVLKYKHMSKKNNLIQRFLDKHAPKPEPRKGPGGPGDGETLHDAVQDLAAQIRRVQPNLMGAVAKVSNKIEEEGRKGRIRERDLMKGMVELLDENVENLSTGVQGFRERKTAISQKVMANSSKR
jgi:DNA repair exonuclease SbcCD ATPase subunit